MQSGYGQPSGFICLTAATNSASMRQNLYKRVVDLIIKTAGKPLTETNGLFLQNQSMERGYTPMPCTQLKQHFVMGHEPTISIGYANEEILTPGLPQHYTLVMLGRFVDPNQRECVNVFKTGLLWIASTASRWQAEPIKSG